MKSYKENNKKNNKLIDAIEELILIFVVATISIVLYDIYINTDTASQQSYETLKTAKEIETENTGEDISEILENTSKSVVRNIKNRNKRYRNIQFQFRKNFAFRKWNNNFK